MDPEAQHPVPRREGGRGYRVAAVAPFDTDGVRTVEVGIAVWLVAFLALLPFYGQLAAGGNLWWLWTCLAGFGVGLCGREYCVRRRRLRAAGHPGGEAPSGG